MFRHCSGDWKGYHECTNTTPPMVEGVDKYGPVKMCDPGQRCGPVDLTLKRGKGYSSDNLGCIQGEAPSRSNVTCSGHE